MTDGAPLFGKYEHMDEPVMAGTWPIGMEWFVAVAVAVAVDVVAVVGGQEEEQTSRALYFVDVWPRESVQLA
jgi:hypothetical protein